MEIMEISPLLDELEDEIDELEGSLRPIFETSLSVISSTLPLLDKAKLYTLVTYAIESILFSYLKLNNINAREHAVFNELTRVKQYFDKVKAAESPPAEHTSISLNKEAAKRFIKASLRGNGKMALNQVNRQPVENTGSHARFCEGSNHHLSEGQKAPLQNTETSGESDSSDSDPALQEDGQSKSMALSKKRKIGSMNDSRKISLVPQALDPETPRDKKRTVQRED